jgi:hypothetical protein
MKFNGIHFTWGFHGPDGMRNCDHAEVMGTIVASETLTEPGTTNTGAPDAREGLGMPLLRIQSKGDAFVAIGMEPDAEAGPRTLVRAGRDIDLYVKPGDRVAWVVA